MKYNPNKNIAEVSLVAFPMQGRMIKAKVLRVFPMENPKDGTLLGLECVNTGERRFGVLRRDNYFEPLRMIAFSYWIDAGGEMFVLINEDDWHKKERIPLNRDDVDLDFFNPSNDDEV